MYVPGHILHVGCGSVGLIFPCPISGAAKNKATATTNKKFFIRTSFFVLGSPPQTRRGGCAAKKRLRSHLNPRRRGGADQENDYVDQHHPSRRYCVGFPLLG